MAEYWISHVEKGDKNVNKVKAFLNTVEGIKNPAIYKKEDIIKSIEDNNDNWYTCILKDKTGGKRIWEKGAKIHTVDMGGTKYIRTDSNKKDSDNLGQLLSLDENTEDTKP